MASDESDNRGADAEGNVDADTKAEEGPRNADPPANQAGQPRSFWKVVPVLALWALYAALMPLAAWLFAQAADTDLSRLHEHASVTILGASGALLAMAALGLWLALRPTAPAWPAVLVACFPAGYGAFRYVKTLGSLTPTPRTVGPVLQSGVTLNAGLYLDTFAYGWLLGAVLLSLSGLLLAFRTRIRTATRRWCTNAACVRR